jgi:hypothetical protein
MSVAVPEGKITPVDTAQSVVRNAERSLAEMLRYREFVLRRCNEALAELHELDRLVRSFEKLLGVDPATLEQPP